MIPTALIQAESHMKQALEKPALGYSNYLTTKTDSEHNMPNKLLLLVILFHYACTEFHVIGFI